ncbi:lysophospholipid acyltransferase family protein [Aureimonas sp. AU4]|uniref:lysophospholipid acyltransferase family protein n=1 Tax=Aureimonas sp. AU4 TaxID=1638163 RepID=UPI0035B5EFE3
MAVSETRAPGWIATGRLVLTVLGLVLLTLALLPLQLVAIRLRWPLARRLPHVWHLVASRISGIRVRVRGAPATGRPLLLVSNHQSWADIVALGAAMPLSFIAKEEVRSWPAFGWLARLQRTVFVARERRGETGRQTDTIGERLASGDVMVLFAEGTTSDGNGVLPFRTALFGAAQASLRASGRAEVTVQPVAVAWTRIHGMPMGLFHRPLAAWPGDVPLVPHLPDFMREAAFDAEVVFGEPLGFTAGTDRKALARLSERRVRELLVGALRDPL